MITSGSHQVGPPDRRAGMGFGADIEIGDGTWIGARCTILAGARIGRGSIVAGGAVVRSGQYPDNVLLAGVPAVPKRCLEG
jgi:acetyltransferase-like isoleucine patch superfamily enzyme